MKKDKAKKGTLLKKSKALTIRKNILWKRKLKDAKLSAGSKPKISIPLILPNLQKKVRKNKKLWFPIILQAIL